MDEVSKARDRRLIEALLTESSNEKAFKAAGVSHTVGYRRLSDPEFRWELRTVVDEFVASGVARLRASQSRAVETLLDLLGDESPQIRLRAAAVLLQTINQRVEEFDEDATNFARAIQQVLKDAPTDMKQFFIERLKAQQGAS